MKFKRMAVAAAALTGAMAAAVPASAITIAHARAGSFADADGDPFTTRAPSADIAIATELTVVDDGRQAKPTSFAAIADELYDIVAPLTFTVDPAEGDDAGRSVTTISFAPDRGPIVVRRRAAGAFDAKVSDASILPEAATWAMMLVGFGMVGFGMRYGIRRSNAKFDLKVQRIAAGLEA